MSNNKLQKYSVFELFSSGDYIIPMYQRNYSWSVIEIDQLLDDVYDFWKGLSAEKFAQNYYLGTMVVYDRLTNMERIYETVDGQQRLTTLNIILGVLQNEFNNAFEFENVKPIIQFENRNSSTEAIMQCFSGNFNLDVKCNSHIKDAYFIVKRKVKQIYEKIISSKMGRCFVDFVKCFLNNVCLICVHLPQDTDLNHYFEIMNNRGEQLEKHEILKAQLLGYLNDIECVKEKEISKKVLNLIWEGCSNMNYYIQTAFSPENRSLIFGDEWCEFKIKKFDDLIKIYENSEEEGENLESIDEIVFSKSVLNASGDLNSNYSINDSDRFNSIIDFQNFLLHVLLIKNKGIESNLDDKRLIENFRFVAELEDKKKQIEFVKEFLFILLELRFLFDQFIIKREVLNERDAWSLKKLNCYSTDGKGPIQFNNAFGDDDKNTNKWIVFLLSMFHTGMPSMSYKYWLNGVLKYLYDEYSNTNNIISVNFINYLNDFAKRIIYERFLSKSEVDYIDLIYKTSNYIAKTLDDENINPFLKYDSIKNNFVFNFIDYLFWFEIKNGKEFDNIAGIKVFAEKFEFTFRSSIDHYFPQHPNDGNKLDPEFLHSIGNLALISHSKNSSMGNYLPKAKKEHYNNGKSADSIKQYIMFNKYPDQSWGKKEILDHQKVVLDILKKEFAKADLVLSIQI